MQNGQQTELAKCPINKNETKKERITEENNTKETIFMQDKSRQNNRNK